MQPQPDPGELLDMLCLFRGLYALQGREDRTSILSIEAAVVYGEGMLRVARRREEAEARRKAHLSTEISSS